MTRLPPLRMLTRPTELGLSPRATFLALFSVDATTAGSWDRHRHSDHEIIFVEKGRYRGRLNEVELDLPAGGLVLVKPGDWHEDEVSTGVRYHALWFRLARGQLVRPSSDARGQIVPHGRTICIQELQQLIASAEHGASAARLDAVLAPLLWRVADTLPPTSLAAPFIPQPAGLATDLALIFSRTESRKLSVTELAQILGVSPRSLERRCRDELGHGPARAYTQWRMARAAQLLLGTDWPVRAVSDALGFANPFHFSRAFVRHHGQPPARWRELGGKSEPGGKG